MWFNIIAHSIITKYHICKNNQQSPLAILQRAIYGLLVFYILFITILVSGCPTLPLEYPVQGVDQYRWTSTKGGLAVAIHPLVNETENKKYFGTDLIARGILPVLIVFQNLH